jgi:hypothetical protein
MAKKPNKQTNTKHLNFFSDCEFWFVLACVIAEPCLPSSYLA